METPPDESLTFSPRDCEKDQSFGQVSSRGALVLPYRVEVVLREIRTWIEAVVCNIPGEIGIIVRNAYFKRRFGGMGAGCRIAAGATIYHKSGLHIGRSVIIGKVDINAKAGVKIGDGCLIANGVKIWSINHRFDDPHTSIADQGYQHGPVSIDADVWIASNAVILPGVIIGRGAVIAAGAIVTREVRPLTIVAGVPAREIGKRGESN